MTVYIICGEVVTARTRAKGAEGEVVVGSPTSQRPSSGRVEPLAGRKNPIGRIRAKGSSSDWAGALSREQEVESALGLPT
jgi:hypothetical protein